MRVLNVIHYPVFGGPHNRALRLAGPLATAGWDTIVLLPDEPGNAQSRLKEAGVAVVTMPLHRLRAVRSVSTHASLARAFPGEVRSIRALIRAHEIDIVLVCGLANPHSAIAASLAGVPVVWQVTDSRTPPPIRATLAPFVRRLSDAVMANGEALLDLHFGRRLPRVPTLIYYPPVDTTRFVPDTERRAAIRTELRIPPDSPVIGTVAHLVPLKGIEYFIRAAKRLEPTLEQPHFVVAGGQHATHAEYAKQVVAEAHASVIPAERLHFLGSRDDVERVYPCFDVCVVSSVPASEGTTTTALEAMACGVPVVATDVGAVTEVVENGETGLVVPPCNPSALAEAVLRLMTNAVMRLQFSARARETAASRFAVPVCADTHIRAFEAALSHHAGCGRPKHRA
jgi:glycosyltransferase involved in cell wall biosynthesis